MVIYDIICNFAHILNVIYNMNSDFQYTSCTIGSKSCKCFEKLTKDEIELLNANSVFIKYNKKEVICKQGSFVSHIMYMEEGLAKVFIEDGQNSLVLKIIPTGNLLGLSSVSEELNTFPYSAMTYVDSVVRQIDINIFRQFISQNVDFAKSIIDMMSANSIQVYGRFFCLTHKQAYGKLADILLCLAERIFNQYEFDLPISRKDLADLTGMSPETVIRMLKKFNDDGLINMDGKTFKISDTKRLRSISNKG